MVPGFPVKPQELLSMSPITHFLLSWTVGDRATPTSRDSFLIGIAGILPDLDSAGIVVDLLSPRLGGPETELYATYHRVGLHGGPGLLLLAGLITLFANRRLLVFPMALLVGHLHIFCDILGSRGATPEEIWPIWYFAPFTTESGLLSWSGQWPLNAWQNVVLTICLMLWVGRVMYKSDRSPFLPAAVRVHKAVRDVLLKRLGEPTSEA